MLGNVGEWTGSYFSQWRAFFYRGGCWFSDAQDCRPMDRYALTASGLGSGLGFRVALVPSSSKGRLFNFIDVCGSMIVKRRAD